MRLIVFDVDHGLCAFLKTPNGMTNLFDLGCKTNFSPLLYIKENEIDSSQKPEEYKIGRLVITHPHGDHLDDILYLDDYEMRPWLLLGRNYNWDEVREKEKRTELDVLEEYIKYKTEVYTGNEPDPPPDWRCNISFYGLLSDEAKEINKEKFINNSSIVTFIQWHDWKICLPGDVEKDGFEELLKNESFRKKVKNTYIFIAPHHGHKSSFSEELFRIMGKPLVNIYSAKPRDGNVDTRYSSSDYAQGVIIEGNDEKKYSLTTKQYGTIFVNMYVEENNKHTYKIKCKNLPDNR